MYAASSTSSPCARLMIFIVPNTRARPSAISAYDVPVSRPEYKACRMSSVKALPRHARVHHLPVGELLRPHDHHLLALVLAHAMREVGVVALVVEGDLAD